MAEVWWSQLHSARILRLLRWGSLLVPLLLAAVSGAALWRGAVQDAREQAQANAGLLRDFMFRLVEAQDVMLTAADAALDRAGLADNGGFGMHRFLAEMQSRMELGVGVALVAMDGEFLLSSEAHPPVGVVGPRGYLAASYEETPVFVDRARVEPAGFEALLVARRRNAQPMPGVWVSGVRIEAVEDFLAGMADAQDAAALVLRADGSLLLRHPDPGPVAPLDAAGPAMQAIAGAPPGGLYEAEGVDGVRRLYAYARVEGTPLYAIYGLSTRRLLTDWLGAFAGVAGVLGALSLTGFGLVRSASRSLEAEAAQAALRFNRQLLAEAEKTAQAREMMLRELNHRVKNSLQMIHSLIRLQAQRPGGPDLDAIVSRVMAIAAIHDLLYRSASSFEIDLAALLEQILASDAIVPPERNIVVERRLERLTVDANVATPLALCAIELITNAAKHAFGPEGGVIAVTLRRDGAQARLSVADDGGGIPEGPARSSGLRVVEALAVQLGGALRVEREGGARFEIVFPFAGGAEAGPGEAAGAGPVLPPAGAAAPA